MSLPWSKLQVKLGHCGRVRCDPGWRLDAAWSTRLHDFDLWYVWAGKGLMKLLDREVVLRRGVCFWMRPGGQYLASQQATDRLGVTFVHFQLEDAMGQHHPTAGCSLPDLPTESHIVNPTGCTEAMLHRVVELVGPPAADCGDMDRRLAETLLWAVLMEIDAAAQRPAASLAGTAKRYHDVAEQVAQRIDEQPSVSLTVTDLASDVGCSADHLTRMFRAARGVTVQEYLLATRIARAQQLLRESSLTISQIADVLGYDDVFYFSRQFKQKVGVPPTRYRQTGSIASLE